MLNIILTVLFIFQKISLEKSKSLLFYEERIFEFIIHVYYTPYFLVKEEMKNVFPLFFKHPFKRFDFTFIMRSDKLSYSWMSINVEAHT